MNVYKGPGAKRNTVLVVFKNLSFSCFSERSQLLLRQWGEQLDHLQEHEDQQGEGKQRRRRRQLQRQEAHPHGDVLEQ